MHGYNNFPSDREYALCAWHPDKKAPVFWTSKVMIFGTTVSVNHFCRLPILLEHIGTRLAATIARSYVDDWIITDFLHAGDSAQQCISSIHKAIRIPLHTCNHPSCPNCTSNPRGTAPDPKPKCKRRRPAAVQEFLGTICDVTDAHLDRVSYWFKPSRCSKILSFLRNVKETNHMTPKAAQRLDGKMQFLTRSSLFESVGRAQTSCIRRRAHSKCVVQDCQTDTSTTCHATTPCCSWNSSSTQTACRIGLCPSLMTNRSSYIPTTRDPTSVSVSLCGTIYSQQQLSLPLTHAPHGY